MRGLRSIGLNEEEAGMYEVLLGLGEITLADIANCTGFHPQIVHRLVDRLIAKKMAVSFTRRHRRYVRAEDPHMVELQAQKRLQDLQHDLPRLLALQKEVSQPFVRVASGNEAVVDLRMRGMKELKSKGIYYIVGGSGDRYYDAVAHHHASIERLRIRKKIQRKLITSISQRPLLRKHETHMQYSAFRYLPDVFSIPSSTNIFNDTVAMIIWANDPVVISIDSAPVARSYRQYFDVLWRSAKGRE